MHLVELRVPSDKVVGIFDIGLWFEGNSQEQNCEGRESVLICVSIVVRIFPRSPAPPLLRFPLSRSCMTFGSPIVLGSYQLETPLDLHITSSRQAAREIRMLRVYKRKKYQLHVILATMVRSCWADVGVAVRSFGFDSSTKIALIGAATRVIESAKQGQLFDKPASTCRYSGRISTGRQGQCFLFAHS